MTSFEVDGAVFVVHEGKTTKVPYKRSVMDSGREWFSLYPERGTDKAIIEEATACLRHAHYVPKASLSLTIFWRVRQLESA